MGVFDSGKSFGSTFGTMLGGYLGGGLGAQAGNRIGGVVGGGMPAIDSALGIGGGGLGAGLNQQPLPTMPNITSPVTADQLGGASSGVGNSLQGQQALLAALQGAGGVGNQSQVFQQGQGLANQLGGLNGTGVMGASINQQGALNTQLGGANGVGTQQAGVAGLLDVLRLQQGTGRQLQGIANGTGPNPAQAMLNQQTGQNVANQAALMAGQRGAGANVGLMARQAAQQGAATQQQAIGQAATLQAQQQLNAINALTGQQQAMAGTNQALVGAGQGLVGQQQAGINAGYGQGAGIVGAQQTQQGLNAGIAQNQVANTLGAANQLTQGQLGNQGQVLGAQGQYNADLVSAQGNVNTNNTAMNTSAMQGRQGVFGGLMQAAGPAASGIMSMFGGAGADAAGAAGLDAGGSAAGDAAGADVAMAAATAARGGIVHRRRYADGGDVFEPDSGPSTVQAPSPLQQAGPASSYTKFLAGLSLNDQPGAKALQKGTAAGLTGLISALTGQSGNGGGAAPPVPGAVPDAARGGLSSKGGAVNANKPSEKAVKSGNSYRNDKIPAYLSENEIVLPRTVTMSADPASAAADFVRKVMAKRGRAS